MEFKELTDEQWSFLQGFMPPAPKRGCPRLDDRKVLSVWTPTYIIESPFVLETGKFVIL